MIIHDSLHAGGVTGTAITIGTCDGVHRGHRFLLQQLNQEATRRGLAPTLITFHDLPYCYFFPERCPQLLTLPEEKAALLADSGLAHLFLVPFEAGIAQQTASQFLEFLVRTLGLRLLLVGADFALGKDRQGTGPVLQQLGRDLGVEVLILRERILDEGQPVSSTRAREAVEQGECALAERLLGYPYQFTGRVVSGQQLGRRLHMPTINLELPARKVPPANGIYAARARLGADDQWRPVALNAGQRPTVGGLGYAIEFYVIDEAIPEPPSQATVQLVAHLRDEVKFPDLDSLVAQMWRDVAQAREILSG